uniref:Isopentenyl-diphosphate delta-isomerase n=1 Tax=Thermosporothrix sp. COM3 TaxID=2490863 RepID=A0A455SP30_9CHLR|nr:type 2 isopentenyl-diphosphate Delta-isomerase [Thermosporothrix sp. COM3]
MTDEVKQRKLEHVKIALEEDVAVPQRANWNDVHFVHQSLPEVNLDAIDMSVEFLGQRLRYPIFISSLTGGHPDVTTINRNLARAAEEYGLALGVGSQRAALVNAEVEGSFAITRQQAPHAFLIANIGAPQLIAQEGHPAFTLEQIQRAISMIGANALAVHLNSLQEATQPEGDRRAVGIASSLQALTKQLPLPVIAKETGAGICREQALLFRSYGIAAIDVGGAGGSSMPALEAMRARSHGNTAAMNLGLLYQNWGIATPIAIVEASSARVPLIATGGIRTGLDMARALALGATLVGVGLPFLKAASQSYEAVQEWLERFIQELKIAMQLSGAASIAQMREVDVVLLGETREWLTVRGFENEIKGLAQRRWRRFQATQPEA